VILVNLKKYDKQTYIEILAITQSGKLFAGACKYSKDVAKINMLKTLQQKSQTAQLKIDNSILFSKNGFSSQLLEYQDTQTTLLSGKHLSSLLDNVTQKELLVYKNRKY